MPMRPPLNVHPMPIDTSLFMKLDAYQFWTVRLRLMSRPFSPTIVKILFLQCAENLCFCQISLYFTIL